MLLMLVWVTKYIGHSSTRTFENTKIVFPTCNFHDNGYTKFLITLIFKIIIKYCIYNINS